MDGFFISTPVEMREEIRSRAKELRLHLNWKQETLAERAGVSLGSLKRFETSGKASLELVLRIAHAMQCLDDFGKLFPVPSARSIEELEARAGEESLRRRGRG